MSRYDRLVKRLFNTNLFGGMKLGLENMRELDLAFSCPHRHYKTIHIAGSNGKGSVASMISKALHFGGYKVGLFTSPHVSCFRERIRINGEMISEEDVEKYLSELFEVIDEEGIPATFFELTTMLAFYYFHKKGVDFAVIETGLGGRLDATNIIHPILSVVTSISLDHTEILGESLDEIAREKAGVIKQGVPVVVGPKARPQIMKEVALWTRSGFMEVKGRFRDYEAENQAIARVALGYIRRCNPLDDEAIENGVNSRLPCRFEVIPKQKLQAEEAPDLLVLDAAHNPEGVFRLCSALARNFPDRSLRVVIGVSKIKDVKACLNHVLKHVEAVHLVEAPNGRGASAEHMACILEEKGVLAASTGLPIQNTVRQAMKLAYTNNEILVICGSFFIMSEARQALGISEPRDFVDLNERMISGAKVGR
ncbi:Folylpolyglutamate synthase [Chlamydiales bacterium SCGC AG-110-M15]|nr:Folylpolyglutamate synthase [Chlamydiales bacterium SCGC AG-110-M15]